MASVDTTTPPPSSTIRTPPTPRLGWEDDYQPYSSRKSARLSARQTSRRAQTPPPPSKTRSVRSAHAASPPSSPPTARKRDIPNGFSTGSSRRVSGALTDDSTNSAAEALGLSPPEKMQKAESLNPAAAVRGNGMLPTPSKTPKKNHSKERANINAVARNLFTRSDAEEVVPTPRKKKAKPAGIALDSFRSEDDIPPIQIYNDPQDRIPEKDMSSENPFFKRNGAGTSKSSKSIDKGKLIQIPGEGEVTLAEAESREDGMVYVFRGKKIFRKFSDSGAEDGSLEEPEIEEAEVLASTVEDPELARPLTRSSIKPRLLFPPAKSAAVDDDEEAVTDIEESTQEVSTPTKHTHKPTSTPKAARFGPVSPPTTTRGRGRLQNRGISPIPIPCLDGNDSPSSTPPARRGGKSRAGKVSPFDEWQRRKPISSTNDKKREAELMGQDDGVVSKRLRGSA